MEVCHGPSNAEINSVPRHALQDLGYGGVGDCHLCCCPSFRSLKLKLDCAVTRQGCNNELSQQDLDNLEEGTLRFAMERLL